VPESAPRRRRLAGLAFASTIALFLVYAIATLREHAVSDATAVGPLRVRTDLMRGQPCHVADQMIVGDCAPDEIAALQREARMRTSAPNGR